MSVLFFGSKACRNLVPWPGIEHTLPCTWKVNLNQAPPGKSLNQCILVTYYPSIFFFLTKVSLIIQKYVLLVNNSNPTSRNQTESFLSVLVLISLKPRSNQTIEFEEYYLGTLLLCTIYCFDLCIYFYIKEIILIIDIQPDSFKSSSWTIFPC